MPRENVIKPKVFDIRFLLVMNLFVGVVELAQALNKQTPANNNGNIGAERLGKGERRKQHFYDTCTVQHPSPTSEELTIEDEARNELAYEYTDTTQRPDDLQMNNDCCISKMNMTSPNDIAHPN